MIPMRKNNVLNREFPELLHDFHNFRNLQSADSNLQFVKRNLQQRIKNGQNLHFQTRTTRDVLLTLNTPDQLILSIYLLTSGIVTELLSAFYVSVSLSMALIINFPANLNPWCYIIFYLQVRRLCSKAESKASKHVTIFP